MNGRRLPFLVVAAVLASPALPSPAVPGLTAQDVTWSGQIRPRYEYRDPVGTGPDEFTSMRTRVGLRALLDPGLSVVVEVQDVRIWGEERSTVADFRADALDVHQAFLRYRAPALPWLTTTLGRQETAFGGQRLIGVVDWTQQGRVFDGARLDLEGSRARVALVAHVLADATAATQENDAELFGAYATVERVGPGALDLYVLYDRAEGVAETDEATWGARWVLDAAGFTGRVEGSLQRGDRAGRPVAASMVGARLGRSFAEGRASVTLWYDHLSGDDPEDADVNAFRTLYATNHKFYGFADLFLDIPAHTGGRGLRDRALKLAFRPSDAVEVGAAVHSFAAARDAGLASGHFADELDLTVRARLSAGLTVTVGASQVWQDDALAAVGRLSRDMTFGYVMVDAVF